jgi:hypothetical protein
MIGFRLQPQKMPQGWPILASVNTDSIPLIGELGGFDVMLQPLHPEHLIDFPEHPERSDNDHIQGEVNSPYKRAIDEE